MIKFFSKNRFIFYFINFSIIFLYLFPGSLLGFVIYDDINIQPQITPDFIISSNHFYIFSIISITGLLTFSISKQRRNIIIYLIFLSIILEVFHLAIPSRSFQLSDLFGNLFGVLIVIFFNSFINKYGKPKN